MSLIVLSSDASQVSDPTTSSGPTIPEEPPTARRRVEGALVGAEVVDSSSDDVPVPESEGPADEEDRHTVQYISSTSSSSAPSARSKAVSVASSASERRRTLQLELIRAREEAVMLRIQRLEAAIDDTQSDAVSQTSCQS